MLVAVQVLRSVPPKHEHAVFGGSIADIRTAIKLPQPLVMQWIVYIGDIDVRPVPFIPENWMNLTFAILAAPPCAVKSLHVKLPNSDHLHKLEFNALQGIVAHTSHLQCLGLYDLNIGAQHLPALHQLFSKCPNSLTNLLLIHREGAEGGVPETHSLFTAVAQLHSLRELHMPPWASFADDRAGPCNSVRSIAELQKLVQRFVQR